MYKTKLIALKPFISDLEFEQLPALQQMVYEKYKGNLLQHFLNGTGQYSHLNKHQINAEQAHSAIH